MEPAANKVIIVLPAWHPRSTEFERQHPPTDAERAKRRAKETGLCPECLGPLYAEAVYCSWCRYKVQAVLS